MRPRNASLDAYHGWTGSCGGCVLLTCMQGDEGGEGGGGRATACGPVAGGFRDTPENKDITERSPTALFDEDAVNAPLTPPPTAPSSPDAPAVPSIATAPRAASDRVVRCGDGAEYPATEKHTKIIHLLRRYVLAQQTRRR